VTTESDHTDIVNAGAVAEGQDDAPIIPTHPQLSPLSVQAASLVRSIDALSNIFWLCFLGFFLSIFFAGLAQLEGNAYTDFIFLGEYQVPKSILPLASLSYAVFAFWLVSNRLKMLGYVMGTTSLSAPMVHDIFHLNPPVLHVFDKDNISPWFPFSGVSVFIFIWSVFFGNITALIYTGAVEQGATMAEFDPLLLIVYLVVIILVVIFGARSIVPPLRGMLNQLHGLTFRIGWQRHCMAFVIMAITFAVNQSGELFSPSDQEDDLLGPDFANAIDGETLYMRGMEIRLFGIDAVERDQVCQDAVGADYECGRAATQALQALLQDEKVICFPLVNINEQRLLAICELVTDAAPAPMSPQEFIREYRPESLSRLMIERGHALGIGLGAQVFEDEQLQAQTLRKGIWQGSFLPPRLWRTTQ